MAFNPNRLLDPQAPAWIYILKTDPIIMKFGQKMCFDENKICKKVKFAKSIVLHFFLLFFNLQINKTKEILGYWFGSFGRH